MASDKPHRCRKVKCDEGKPSCSRCISAGRVCTGYIYITHGEAPAQATADTTTQSAPIARTLPTAEIYGLKDINDLMVLMPKMNSYILTTSDSHAKRIRFTATMYLRHLPCRSGRSVVLDASVRCVAITVRKLWLRYSVAQPESHQRREVLYLGDRDTEMLASYNQALKLLQTALHDPKACMETETLCAAALFCYLEVRCVSRS